MADEEYEGLKADIAMNGVHQPVAVWQGQVIDGRHRYQACQDLGVKAPLPYLDDDANPVSFVLSANMSRRQLTGSQKVIITAQLPRLLNGSNQHHLESNGVKVGIDSVYSAKGRAVLAGVDTSYQARADAIVEYGDTDVIAKVQIGDLSVNDAYQAVRKAKKTEAAAEKAEKARQEAEERAEAEADTKALRQLTPNPSMMGVGHPTPRRGFWCIICAGSEGPKRSPAFLTANLSPLRKGSH